MLMRSCNSDTVTHVWLVQQVMWWKAVQALALAHKKLLLALRCCNALLESTRKVQQGFGSMAAMAMPPGRGSTSGQSNSSQSTHSLRFPILNNNSIFPGAGQQYCNSGAGWG